MTVQRARQQVTWAAAYLREEGCRIDANQLEEAVGVLTAADREAGRHELVRKSYESTVMRMAGNIAAGWVSRIRLNMNWTIEPENRDAIATLTVSVARAIVAEVLRTELQEEKK